MGWDAALERIVTWVELSRASTMDPLIYVFNTHFDHRGGEARRRSAELLARRIGEMVPADVPAFATGDFNAELGNSLFDPILDAMRDARDAPVTDARGTFNGWSDPEGGRVIDYVFYRKRAGSEV